MTQVVSSESLVFITLKFAFSIHVEGAAVKAKQKIPCLRTKFKQMYTLSNKLPSLSSDRFAQMSSLPTDFTLICRDGKVRAHRLILCAASAFFLAHCACSPSVLLPQYDVHDILRVLDFVYGRPVTVDLDTMNRLVAIAHDLGLNVFADDQRS